MIGKCKSLSVQLTVFILVDLLVCVLGVLVINFAGDEIIHQYYFSEKNLALEQKHLRSIFQEFIETEKPDSTDWKPLLKWVRKEGYVMLNVYKDGYLVFSSEYGMDNETLVDKKIVESGYEREQCSQMEFPDGLADVELTSLRYLMMNNYLLAGSIVLMSAIFLSAIFLFTYYKFRYISRLSQEIQAVEGGELNREITVKGQDEISVLADSMEKMRRSFTEKIDTIEELQKEQDNLVAEMSHDMRTPLTALMMYLGFLKDGEFKNEQERQAYVEKSYEKTACIKTMMDDMFSYLKIEREKGCELEKAYAPDLLYEFISEIVVLLEQEEFQVEETAKVPDCFILFSAAYMDRIAGNVVSNIRKYADRSEPVKITLHQEDALVHTAGTRVQVLTLMIRNRKQKLTSSQAGLTSMESMGLGVRNMQKLMERMAGDMFCIEDRIIPEEISVDDLEGRTYYELRLMFRISGK